MIVQLLSCFFTLNNNFQHYYNVFKYFSPDKSGVIYLLTYLYITFTIRRKVDIRSQCDLSCIIPGTKASDCFGGDRKKVYIKEAVVNHNVLTNAYHTD